MPPSILFVIILALTIGFLFHSMFGARLWQLPCFAVSAILGAFGGQVLAILIGVEYLRVGNVPIVMTAGGALLMLGLCWFFTAPIPQGSTGTRRRARRMISRQRGASA